MSAAAVTEAEADVPAGYRRCANSQCSNPVQALANFPRMGRGLNRYCRECWQKRSRPMLIGKARLMPATQAEVPIIEPRVAAAIRQRVRQIAGDAAREIADETVRTYLDRELELLVRRVVRDVARETITQAMRTLFGGLAMESEDS